MGNPFSELVRRGGERFACGRDIFECVEEVGANGEHGLRAELFLELHRLPLRHVARAVDGGLVPEPHFERGDIESLAGVFRAFERCDVKVDDLALNLVGATRNRRSDFSFRLGATAFWQTADRCQLLSLVGRVALGTFEFANRDSTAVDLDQDLGHSWPHRFTHVLLETLIPTLLEIGHGMLTDRINTAFNERPVDVVTMMLEHLSSRCPKAHDHREGREHAVESNRSHPRFEPKPLSQWRAVRPTAPTAIAPDLDFERQAGGPNANALALAFATETTSRALSTDLLCTLTKALEHRLKEPELQHAKPLVDKELNGIQPLERLQWLNSHQLPEQRSCRLQPTRYNCFLVGHRAPRAFFNFVGSRWAHTFKFLDALRRKIPERMVDRSRE